MNNLGQYSLYDKCLINVGDGGGGGSWIKMMNGF